ncbi:MAG: DEAD/DEAH box helicase [Bdellovibrionota bacterium]
MPSKNKNNSSAPRKPKLSPEERAAKRAQTMERARLEAARLEAKRLLEDKSFIDLYNQYVEKGAPPSIHFHKLSPWLAEDLRLVAFYGAHYTSLPLFPAGVRKAFNDMHERFFMKINSLYELLSIGRPIEAAGDRKMIVDTAFAEFWKSYPHLRKAQHRVVSSVNLVNRLKAEIAEEKNSKSYLDTQEHHLAQALKGLSGELAAITRMTKNTETLLTSTLRGFFISRDRRFSSYESVFEEAHHMGREHVAVLGPTNSGKTHEAMEALKAAKSGIYLAPLRLLALENFERLQSAGLKARLETGEESLGASRDTATHYSMTVEKCPYDKDFDVAVIDEVQMLSDPDRGAGWTAAILGIRARKIYLLGSAASVEVLKRLTSLTQEKITFVFKERLSPLKIETKALNSVRDLQRGDALITFSRDGVLRTKQLLRTSGLKASVIYGGLSPEVRRAETEKFRLGETDVVIATDAIGMGLNLPIRRIIFLETQKYNGEEVVDLSHSQFLQIAGRAGRYALSNGVVTGETGLAAVIGQGDLPYLQRALSKDMDSLPLSSLVAEPLMLHINVLSEELKTDDLVDILDAFTYRSSDDSIRRYISPSLSEAAACLEDYLLELREEDALEYPMTLHQKFFLSRLPLRLNEDSHYEFFRSLIRSFAIRGTHLRPEEAFQHLDHVERVDLKACELERGLVTAYLHLSLTEEERAHTISHRLELDNRSEALLSQGKGAKESDKIAWPTICERCHRSMGKPANFKLCRPCFAETRRKDRSQND